MAKYFRRDNKKKKKKGAKNNNHQVARCSVPSFRIDLLCNPAQRWVHVVRSYRKEIKRLIQAILSLEQYQPEDAHDEQEESFFTSLTRGIFARLRKLGGAAYICEMEGIAQLLHKDGIRIEHVLLTHLLYESFCGCTSIAARRVSAKDKDKAEPAAFVMGRTLDWLDFDDQLLRRLTVDIEVFRGSQRLYRYTTFAGYIGALTALKFGRFGFAINFRECSSRAPTESEQQRDSWPIGLLGRFVCDTCDDYESACALWRESLLMAPTYVLLCGLDESLLITRDEAGCLRPLRLPLAEHEEQKSSREYLLQTNVDHWLYGQESGQKKKRKGKGRKQIDNDTMDSVRRLNIGHKCLKEQGGKLTDDGMWRLLYQYPIHDRTWTIYSTVMNVRSGEYKTVRHLYK